MDERTRRALRQHVETDALLGADAVPFRPPSPEESAAEPAGAPASGSVAPAALLGDAAGASPLASVESLAALERDHVRGCRACRLCEGRRQTVFGEGSPGADLVFVGEGPGQSEDEQGRPFVGRAGELLDRMIAAMGLERGDVYIANLVKCRPPENRTPSPDEVETCIGYLKRQLELIAPRVIVTLGGPAAKYLLDTRTGITKIRGTWHLYRGLEPAGPAIDVMPTFHPAYVLRNYTAETRRKVWSDLQQVIEALG